MITRGMWILLQCLCVVATALQRLESFAWDFIPCVLTGGACRGSPQLESDPAPNDPDGTCDQEEIQAPDSPPNSSRARSRTLPWCRTTTFALLLPFIPRRCSESREAKIQEPSKICSKIHERIWLGSLVL